MQRIRAWLRHGLVKHHLPHVLVHVALIAVLIVVLVSAPLSLLDLSHQPKAAGSPVRVVNSHVCDKRDYAQGCALPQATVREIVRGVDPTAQGVDFGWPGASCSALSQAQQFGVSYLSYDTSKDWTRSCIDAFHRVGKKTVAVFEAGAQDTLKGCSEGASQARTAASELRALGAPANQPFTMAIDFDAVGSQLAAVGSYFHCASQAEPGRVNAYGGYDQVSYLYQHHDVGHLNWQTYAWSGGRWLPASVAPLEQYLNSTSVDYDRAIAANYGQWPAPSVKPPVICWGKGSTPSSKPCLALQREAATLWHKYLAFHSAIPKRETQLHHLDGVIASLEANKASVYQVYKGPGLAWIKHQLAVENKATGYKTAHDQIVQAHSR